MFCFLIILYKNLFHIFCYLIIEMFSDGALFFLSTQAYIHTANSFILENSLQFFSEITRGHPYKGRVEKLVNYI